jgi:two-component system sensor histidine kinase PilS (NtrC family)
MDIVMREVDRLNGLLTELLEYARPRERVPMILDLGPLLGETVRVFAQDRTHVGVEVHAREFPELVVHADGAQLRQVVWNLLRNAAEAMPTGGAIDLDARATHDDSGGWAEIVVADAGVGIPTEDVERIFEPFFTTKRKGSGLGLPTVYRIVTDHGGTVSLAARKGSGTIVTVRLPLASAASQASAADARAAHGERGATR